MDWTFVVSIILFFVFVIPLILANRHFKKKVTGLARNREDSIQSSEVYTYNSTYDEGGLRRARRMNTGVRYGMWAAVAVTAVFFLFSFVAFIPANTFGVKVTANKYDGVVESGIQVKVPWTVMDVYSTRQQTTTRNAEWQDGKIVKRNCVAVKASGVEACVDTSVRWNVVKGNKKEVTEQTASALWGNYRDLPTVEEKLINQEINSAFAKVYGGFSARDAFGGDKTGALIIALKTELNNVLDDYGIEVTGLTVGNPNLEPDDQAQINKLFTSEQDILIAKNEVEAAKQRALANEELQGSLNEMILTQRCIDAAREIKPLLITCMAGTDTPIILQPRQ